MPSILKSRHYSQYPAGKRALTGALLSMWVAVSLSFLTLSSCVTTGPGGKKSFMLFGTSDEVAIGKRVDAQVRSESTLLADSVWQDYVNDIGQEFVAVCDRKDLEYYFAVIESDQINAFALPGGYVYFYTGLLRIMDNEAQLAAVMSHEISHVVARHGMKRMQKALIAELGYAAVFGNSGSSKVRDAAVGIGLSLAFAGYSRSAEAEADRYGIQYMTRAGYNPHGAVEMFNRLAEAGSRDPNAFEKLTADHPETKARISNEERQIDAMGELPEGLKFNKDVYQRLKARLPQPSDSAATG